VEETASLFALQARGKGIEFTCEISDSLAMTVASDPERLRQVLTNLLGNSIKFTDEGRIGVTAALIGETLDAIRVRFVVHDTGIGIEKSMLESIFESFTQADTSSTRKYGGTGLGLAISKQLVDLLGGEIGVESELGRGSKFWFTVGLGRPAPGEDAPVPPQASRAQSIAKDAPAVAPFPPPGAPGVSPNAPAKIPPPAARPAPPPSSPNLSANSSPASSTRRILLAEDNEINQRITLRLLEKLGLPADAVVNGQQASESAGQKKYDLILMDCQMPIMDGFEATAVIRHREGSDRHTPICALTANAMEGDREKCLAAGMDDYITKPISIDKLREAVERWVPRATAPVPGA
jgi:CheY-like chemotaxis protein